MNRLVRGAAPLLIALVLLFSAACAGVPDASVSGGALVSAGSDPGSLSPDEVSGPAIRLYKAGKVDLLSSDTRAFIEKYSSQIPIDWSLGEANRGVMVRPGSAVLSWDWGELVVEDGSVALGLLPDLSDAVEYPSQANTLELKINLLPGQTYYWQVIARTDDGIVKSEVASFRTAPGLRPITIGGVGNSRDLGGWRTEDGLTLKYGLLYRSAQLTDVTESGRKTAVEDLGIVSDIDLRGREGTWDNKEEGVGPLGKSVTYFNFSATSYLTGVKSKTTANEIRPLADPANYPAIFHCAAGADRAGTMAALIEGICGCPISVLVTDYELTNGRWRTYQDGSFQKMLELLDAQQGDCFRDKVWYVMRKLGLTLMELSNVRNIMTGDSAVFATDSLTAGKPVSGGVCFTVDLRQSGGIASVTVDGASVPYTFRDGELTVQAASGEGVVTFKDGGFLRFQL